MTTIQFDVGSPNGNGKRPVVYKYDGREYSDQVDTASGFQRSESLKRGLAGLGLDPTKLGNLGALDAEIGRLAAEKDKAASGGEAKERFPLVTCQALDAADYTPRPIITDCLYAEHPAYDGGMFKTCKTLLAADAAISVATGRPFLNTFTVPEPMSVVYFSGEGGPSMTQEYGRRIAASKGLRLGDVYNLHWCFSVPRLENMNDLDAMGKVIEDTAAELVIVDNLMLAMSGENAGNVMAMSSVISEAIRVCAERGATPLIVHHFKRTRATADPYAPGELADLTQAGAAETAGQWWLLTRRERYNPDQPGEHKLWLNIGGRLGHGCLHALDISEGRLSDPSGRRWDVEVMRPDDARQAVEDRQEQAQADKAQRQAEADQKRLCEAMASLERQHPEGNSKTAIRDRSYLKGQRFENALDAVLEAGCAVCCEFQRSNHKTLTAGYRLAERTE